MRFLLVLLILFFASLTAEAGPIRDRIKARRAAKVTTCTPASAPVLPTASVVPSLATGDCANGKCALPKQGFFFRR